MNKSIQFHIDWLVLELLAKCADVYEIFVLIVMYDWCLRIVRYLD